MSALTGNWRVDLEFVRGRARHAACLEQVGEELRGRYRSAFGEHAVSGRVRDAVVEMQVDIHYQGVGTGYSFRGRVDGSRMSGEVGLGEYGRARWEARREDQSR